MYTLTNNKTQAVMHTGLTRQRMEFLKTEDMSFHFEPDFEFKPTVGITKYEKDTHTFIHLTMEEIKEARTKELVDSDWRMVSDYQGSDQEIWKTYRQSLRDIPQDYSKVEDVVFPAKP